MLTTAMVVVLLTRVGASVAEVDGDGGVGRQERRRAMLGPSSDLL
jgi:hypothetical protein